MGTPVGMDLSHPLRIYGVQPKVYYSTQSLDPNTYAAHKLTKEDGSINRDYWLDFPADGSFPAGLKTIAFDMRYKTDGQPFTLPADSTLTIVIQMKAPADARPYLPPVADPAILAWNRAFFQINSAGGTSTEAVNPTTVKLRFVDLKLDKYPLNTNPDNPPLVNQDGTLQYILNLKNTNTAETITGIKLVDVIPDGLIFNEADIKYNLSQSGTYNYFPVVGSDYISLSREGQKLTFSLPSLKPGETLSLQIPTTVPKASETSPTLFVNTAKVTEAIGVEQEISSLPVYHRTLKVSQPLTLKKQLNAGGRTLKAGEFTLAMKDAGGNVLQTVSNNAAGEFVFEPLWFGKTSSSSNTYNYYMS